MLLQQFVFQESKNFTSDNGIQIPPTVSLYHYNNITTNNNTLLPYNIVPCSYMQGNTCFKHFNFFTV